MKKVFGVILLLSVTVFALSACGVAGQSGIIDVSMDEFTFAPSEFSIPSGREITVHATNNGAVLHDFVIYKLGSDPGDHFNNEDLNKVYWQVKVQPGESLTVTFTAPTEPGQYSITCGISGHLEAGMIGKLIVVAAE